MMFAREIHKPTSLFALASIRPKVDLTQWTIRAFQTARVNCIDELGVVFGKHVICVEQIKARTQLNDSILSSYKQKITYCSYSYSHLLDLNLLSQPTFLLLFVQRIHIPNRRYKLDKLDNGDLIDLNFLILHESPCCDLNFNKVFQYQCLFHISFKVFVRLPMQ